MRFNRILTLVKTNLILRRNRHNYKIIERNKRKNPSKPVNVAMKHLTQQLLFAVMFGTLFGIPERCLDVHTLHFNSERRFFLFLMILVSQALPAIYNVFCESKDFESFALCLYGIRSRSWKSLSIVVATLQGLLQS